MVADPLRELARRQPSRRALVDRSAGFWISWFDLDGLAHAWARRLEGLGVRPGDRVATLEPAGVRFSGLLPGRGGGGWAPPEAVRGERGDACVLYTSGTMGEPKGVRLTLANLVASARGCAARLEATDRDRWLLVLSPHHVGGLSILVRSVISAQPVIAVARFEEPVVLEALEAERPTLVSLVPTMVIRLLAAGGLEALRGPRAILVGGAAAPAGQVRQWAELGL